VVTAFLTWRAPAPALVYAGCAAIGLACGYWAVFVTVAAEQFGTNLRSTVAGVVPNLVRGAVPLWSLALGALAAPLGLPGATLALALSVIAVALVAAWLMRETYAVDLDYVER
jgi:hypothetical protein